MKNLIVGILAVVFMFVGVISTNAMLVDTDTGGEYSFRWVEGGTGGLGQIDLIKEGLTTQGIWTQDVTWEVEVGVDSLITIDAYDSYMPGDEFKLYVDGIMTDWTATWIETYGHFHGQYTDLFLTSGLTHEITLHVTERAEYPSGLPYTYGAGYSIFSETTDAETAPVPEPATMLLLGTGLFGLGVLKRKFKK